MPLATSGKQQFIRWLCGETCAAAWRAGGQQGLKTAVALNAPQPAHTAIAGAGDHGGCLQGGRLYDDGGAALREQLGGTAFCGKIDCMRVDRDRAGEHVGSGARCRRDPSEAVSVAAGNRDACRCRCRGGEIAGNALGEAAGAENQDVTGRHWMSLDVPGCPWMWPGPIIRSLLPPCWCRGDDLSAFSDACQRSCHKALLERGLCPRSVA